MNIPKYAMWIAFCLIAFCLIIFVFGCQYSEVTIDTVSPQITKTSILFDASMRPTDSIVLWFNEPMDIATITNANLFIVPYTKGDPCTTDLDCSHGLCSFGRCQTSPINTAWLNDAMHPPLSDRRIESLSPLRVKTDMEGMIATLTPMVPFAEHTMHTLVVSPGVRDLAGNPLVTNANMQTSNVESPHLPCSTGACSNAPWNLIFSTTSLSEGSPTMKLEWPASGNKETPLNLNHIAIQFSQAVHGVSPSSVYLQTRSGQIIRFSYVKEQLTSDDPPKKSYELGIQTNLPPNQVIRVVATDSIHNEWDIPLFIGTPPVFATTDRADDVPPTWNATFLGTSEGCVLIRGSTDEPAEVEATTTPFSMLRISKGTTHEMVFNYNQTGHYPYSFKAPPPSTVQPKNKEDPEPSVQHDVMIDLTLRLRDLAGHQRTIKPGAHTLLRTNPIIITEVLANPMGTEPSQEFVEIYNRSNTPIPLIGWTLDDIGDGLRINTLPPVSLEPGQFGVIVGVNYNLQSPVDKKPHPKALLIRLDETLGNNGLANSGEPLFLRDAHGSIMSTYGNHVQSAGKPANGSSVERIDFTQCDIASNWRANVKGTSTPGEAP